MMLVDTDIKQAILDGQIEIRPFDIKSLGSNSYDLTLGDKLLVYTEKRLDAKKPNPFKYVDIPREGFTLLPGELYLGFTNEYTFTKDLVPQLEGKSSIGRLGICVHLTAGFGDVGFAGHWTLEITCVKPVTIYASMPIAQMFWFRTSGYCLNPYSIKSNSKYGNQPAIPIPSAMWKNFIQ
jgi:dCTP deaminase